MEPPASPQTVIRDCVPQSPPYPFRAHSTKNLPKTGMLEADFGNIVEKHSNNNFT